jgi:signal transduction histidine kinase
VIVSIQASEEQMQVDVKDNGVGIDPAVQHRIFDRFYRGEDPLVLATSGFGLGLSLSKNLIEMHGGKIWFTSSGIPGEGSVFSFTIPLTQPEE